MSERTDRTDTDDSTAMFGSDATHRASTPLGASAPPWQRVSHQDGGANGSSPSGPGSTGPGPAPRGAHERGSDDTTVKGFAGTPSGNGAHAPNPFLTPANQRPGTPSGGPGSNGSSAGPGPRPGGPGPGPGGPGGPGSPSGPGKHSGPAHGGPAGLGTPPAVMPGPAIPSGQRPPMTSARPTARPQARGRSARAGAPRRASLQIRRFDPWSVLKLSLVLSVAMFLMWLVAVGVLYGVLDGMGVWDKLNGAYSDLASVNESTGNAEPLISASRVFGVSAVIGLVNIVLFTAFATVSAFIYNVSADLAGGVELTLAERD